MPVLQIVPMASSVNKKPMQPFPIQDNKSITINLIDEDFRKGYLFYDGILLKDFNVKSMTLKKSSKSVKLGFIDLNKFKLKYFEWVY